MIWLVESYLATNDDLKLPLGGQPRKIFIVLNTQRWISYMRLCAKMVSDCLRIYFVFVRPKQSTLLNNIIFFIKGTYRMELCLFVCLFYAYSTLFRGLRWLRGWVIGMSIDLKKRNIFKLKIKKIIQRQCGI